MSIPSTGLPVASRDRDRDAPVADRELDDRPVGLARQLDVERNVLRHVGAHVVVVDREGVRRRSRRPMVQSPDGRAGPGNRGAERDRGRLDPRRARGGARPLPRPQERARAGPPRGARPRDRDDAERAPRPARGGARRAARGARARRARPRADRGASSTSRSPATQLPARPPAPDHAGAARRSRTSSSASATRSATTARSRRSSTTSTSSRFDPWHPARSPRATFFLDDDRAAAHRDLAEPDPRAWRSSEPPIYMVSIGRVLPARRRSTRRTTRSSTSSRASPSTAGITLADLKGTLLHVMRALFGPDRRVRFRTHYFPFTEPSMEPDVSCGDLRRRGLPHLQATRAGSRWAARGWSTRTCSRTSASTPRSGRGFAFGCGIERVAQLRYDFPDIRAVLGERPPRPEAVLMRVPVSLAARVRPDRDAAATSSPTRLSISTAEVEGIERRGVPDDDGNLGLFRVGRVLEAEQAPERRPAPALPRSTWGRASRARSSAAPGTSAPARRSPSRCRARVLPDGLAARAAQAARRALRRDDPRRGRGRARHRPLRDHGARRTARAGHAARATCCRSSRRCSIVESTGNRPDLLSIYGLAREVAALYDLRACADAGRRPRARPATSRSTSRIEDFEGCPRYIGRLFRDVAIGAVAGLAARRACTSAGMRPISNVVDVTNYVMLALGNPLHAFDLDKLARRPHRRPPRAAGREDPHARRRRAQARARATS